MSNDPFQWLEEVESKEALDWEEQWNKKSLDDGLGVVMEKEHLKFTHIQNKIAFQT